MNQRALRLLIVLLGLTFVQFVFLAREFHSRTVAYIDVPRYFKIYEEKDTSWIEKVFDDPVALFTLVLAMFTGGLYLATRALWTSTEKLVIGAENTSARQLRAYVGIQSADVRKRFPNGTPSRIELALKNFGSTPALRCNIRSTLWCSIG